MRIAGEESGKLLMGVESPSELRGTVRGWFGVFILRSVKEQEFDNISFVFNIN